MADDNGEGLYTQIKNLGKKKEEKVVKKDVLEHASSLAFENFIKAREEREARLRKEIENSRMFTNLGITNTYESRPSSYTIGTDIATNLNEPISTKKSENPKVDKHFIIRKLENRYHGVYCIFINDVTGKYKHLLYKKAQIVDYLIKVEDNEIKENSNILYNINLRLRFNISGQKYEVWTSAIDVILEKDLQQVTDDNIKINRKLNISPDNFGNSFIVELSNKKDGEIYLSSALRGLLRIENEDCVSFAYNEEEQELYICKDEQGHKVVDGKLYNEIDWRDILYKYNPHNVDSDFYKYRFDINPYPITDINNPEYTFYAFDLPVVTKREKVFEEENEIDMGMEDLDPNF